MEQSDNNEQQTPRRNLAFKNTGTAYPSDATSRRSTHPLDRRILLCSLVYCGSLHPVVFETTLYSFNKLQVGLCYLPGAAGVITSIYISGRVIDHNYRILASRQSQQPSDPGHQEKSTITATASARSDKPHDITHFLIERARSRFCLPLTMASLAFSIGYGWTIPAGLHPAVPLVFQFCMGFLCTWILSMFNALLVDVFPEAPITAATAGNLVRCGFSAAAVALLDPLTRATNQGWFFTLMGLLSGVFGLIAIPILNRHGMQWRQRQGRLKDAATN